MNQIEHDYLYFCVLYNKMLNKALFISIYNVTAWEEGAKIAEGAKTIMRSSIEKLFEVLRR